MPLRILHTADNHIGLSFAQYPDLVRDRLLEERFSALERLVDTANERQAHFFVVAGDLFDKQTVTKKLVERAVATLAGFGGEHVLVLEGDKTMLIWLGKQMLGQVDTPKVAIQNNVASTPAGSVDPATPR